MQQNLTLKSAAEVDTSKVAKQANLVNLKSDVHELSYVM